MTHGHSQSWFGTLRRDGGLFALLCALILLGNLMQPVSAAHATGQDTSWALCTTHGLAEAEGGDAGHSRDCCTAGTQCGSLAAPKFLPSIEPAFLPPAALAGLHCPAVPAAPPGRALADAPPSIRAPPSFA